MGAVEFKRVSPWNHGSTRFRITETDGLSALLGCGYVEVRY